MTLTIMEDNKSLDIIVKPEQRIQEVYRVLVENGFFSSISEMVQLQVYSKRQGKYINPILHLSKERYMREIFYYTIK